MKLTLLAAAMCGAIALAGCSLLSEDDPARVESATFALPDCDGILNKCKKTTIDYNKPSQKLDFLTQFGDPNSALDLKYGRDMIMRVVTVAPYDDRGLISGDVIQTTYDYNNRPVHQIVAPFIYGVIDGNLKTYSFVFDQNGDLVKQLDSVETRVKGIKKETLAEMRPYMNAEDMATLEQPFPPLCDKENDKITGCVFNEIKVPPKIIGVPSRLIFYKNDKKDLILAIKQAAVSSRYTDEGIWSIYGYYDRIAPWLGLDDFVGRLYSIDRLDNKGLSCESWTFNSDGTLKTAFKNRKYIYEAYKN